MNIKGGLVEAKHCTPIIDIDEWINLIRKGMIGVQSGNRQLILFSDNKKTLFYMVIGSDPSLLTLVDAKKMLWDDLTTALRNGGSEKNIFLLSNISSKNVRQLISKIQGDNWVLDNPNLTIFFNPSKDFTKDKLVI